MKIGAVLTTSSTKALLLENRVLYKELAVSIQRDAVEVFAVDRNNKASGPVEAK